MAHSLSGFISELIRIDLHCHVEVTLAHQGHFGIKSTVVQKR